MNDRIEYKQCYGRYHVPRLTRVAPDLELEIVTAQLIKVSLLVEAELLFQIIPAMIVVEEEVVDARDCEKRVRVQVVLAGCPYLVDNILSKRMLQEFNNLLVIYHVK